MSYGPLINEGHLEGLRAWASVLEASLRDDSRTDRIRDDAHDLVMAVWSLLEDNGQDLINDADAADRALARHIMGAPINDTLAASADAITRMERIAGGLS